MLLHLLRFFFLQGREEAIVQFCGKLIVQFLQREASFLDRADLLNVRADKDSLFSKKLLSQCAGKAKRSRQTAGEMAAAANIVVPVIAEKTAVIGVPGTCNAFK